MAEFVYGIKVSHWEDDGTWGATSDEITGFTVEAESWATFSEAVREVAADLLVANHGLAVEQLGDCTIVVRSWRVVPRRRPHSRRGLPNLVADSEHAPAAA